MLSLISLNGMCFSTLKWRLTDCCNYHCSYCIRRLLGGIGSGKLQQDKEKVNKAVKEVSRIIRELPGFVKLDLIGGEVSLFDLHSLLESLFKDCGDKLKRVNITTNMSESAEYYNDLTQLCYQYNSEIGITCSWHSEFVSLDEFLAKFSQIKSPTNQKGIRIEAVSRVDNQRDIRRLINICDSNSYAYFIEKDMRLIDSNVDLIVKASKLKKPRYKVTYDDGTEELFMTRNEFLAKNNKFVTEVGSRFYCSRDYNYVYIDMDRHQGRTEDEPFCHINVPIEEFHVLKGPMKCKCFECTLCGQISLSRDCNKLLYKE